MLQLLDILACNYVSGGQIEGEILVNGKPRNDYLFRKQSCYVLQQDVLLSSATVKESITTSALLKLPMSLTKEEKLTRVDNVLEELNLVGCQNTLIGDELLGIKGISGGQKRRVSIGIELVKGMYQVVFTVRKSAIVENRVCMLTISAYQIYTWHADPTSIFLDEPTSGLDSEMAVSLLENLKDLCRRNRTVALTIHQPNSIITSKFDDFMLLADGKLVFGGLWSESVDFFKQAGLQCPQFVNPTDFFIRVLNDEENIEKLSKLQSTVAEADISEAGSADSIQTSSREVTSTTSDAAPEVPLWYQTAILASRNFKMYIRNPAMLFAETAQYVFMGLFLGLVYLQLNNSVETGVQDRLASIWFGMAVLSFTPSFTAVVSWEKERVLLRRESGQGMYRIGSWYLAKSCVIIPIQTVQTILFGLVAYFMVGYTITLTNILIYFAAYILFQISSETIGVMCAAVTTTSTYAVLTLTLVLLVLLSFSGFLVSDIPVYFRWVSKISYLTYALAAITISQFDTTEFVCSTGKGCEEGQVYPGSELIPNSVNNGLSPGINLVILLCITIACRILAYILIRGAQRFNFL